MEYQIDTKCFHDEQHFVTNQGFINLTIGAPGVKTLSESRKIFRESAKARLSSEHDNCDIAMFQYGVEEGPTSFINQLSSLLSVGYDDHVDTKNLFLTGGASFGFFLLSAILLPKDKMTPIFVESPTYFLVLKMLKDHDFQNIIPIPMQNDGADIEILEREMKKEYERIPMASQENTEYFRGIFYTIPTYHNPTGVCMSESKCQKVVELARRFNLLVCCDDVYNLLHYTSKTNQSTSGAPKRLVSYDNQKDNDYGSGHVISNGSFSKILAPGVRVGWIESSTEIISRLAKCGMVYSGGSVNSVTSGIIATSIELGLLPRHIEKLRSEYGKRMEACLSILNRKLPDGFECNEPGGGYFLWITGPIDSFDGDRFSHFCMEEFNVKVLPGSRCSSARSPSVNNMKNDRMMCKNAFRISIGYYEQDELCRAVNSLCEACAQFK